MTLALLFSLGCAVHADQISDDPVVLLVNARTSTRAMLEIERMVTMYSDRELSHARDAAQELTSTCPYNRANLQMMGTLIEQVPMDSATREGIDSLARTLAHLQLEPGALSIDEARMELDRVEPAVLVLTPEETAVIAASGAELAFYLGGDAWPPKRSYMGWTDQLRAEGHTELASLLDLAIGGRC